MEYMGQQSTARKCNNPAHRFKEQRPGTPHLTAAVGHRLKFVRNALLPLLLLALFCATAGPRHDIQARIDASIDADRRKDVRARMALFTGDATIELLNGQTLMRAQLEQGIAAFHQSTVSIAPRTRTTIESIEVHGNTAILHTNQHLERTTFGGEGEPVERVSNIRHLETWVRTADGWKVRHVEELEQGEVTVDGKPEPIDRAGLAFSRMLHREGWRKARAEFDAARARGELPFEESTLNTAGYALLAAGRADDAIEAFRMNSEAYPQSVNVWDSLAEAQMNAGHTSEAIAGYRKVLTMTPTDERIAGVLAKLGAPVADEERARMLQTVLPPDVGLLPNVTYATHGRPLRMHILRPTAPAPHPRPALLFIHGGGWTEGTKERGLIALLRFVQRGYVAASMEYRLSGEATFPAQIEDVQAAIRFLRENAAQYGIDATRIAVWGQSAGGHLAALAGATGTGAERPDAVIDWNGPADLVEPVELARLLAQKARQNTPTIALERLLGGPVDEHRELARAASPVYHASPDDPPFLILHGTADPEVDISQSRALHQALRAAGVDATLKEYAREAHFGIHPSRPVPERFASEMDAFLARIFGAP
jgi:acetyl esterase/lipase/ketosteroid isomerase-like protein